MSLLQPDVASYPLLPIQARSLAQRSEGPHHRHLSPSAIEIGDDVVESAFVQALERWVRQDVFRLRIRDVGGEWRQYHRPLITGRDVPIDEWTIADGDQPEIVQRLTDICWDLGHANDIVHGSPFQVGLVRVNGRLRYLLWVVDHLLIDNATFFVLLRRLRAAYEQIVARAPIAFPPDEALFRWAEHLTRRAADGAVIAECRFWRKHWPARTRTTWPPKRSAARSNGRRHARTRVISALSEDETSAVYRFMVRHKVPFEELCFVNFLWAYKQEGRGARVRICLLHNCRHSPFARSVGLSEGCGWFVSMHPAMFDLRARDREAFVADLRRQYAGYADKRDHYGALRYLNPATGARLAEREDWSSTIVFNCLGELIAPTTGQHVLRLTPLCFQVHAAFLERVNRSGDGPAGGGAPEHPRFTCICLVVDGKIHLVLQFDETRQDAAAMAALIRRAGASLVELVDESHPAPAAGAL